ncbi:C-type lectin domain family 4 member A-like isoform X2 [Gambusia affinis]|uniref:C-type lectin domain family 4 member A-like isoform X2 n=1 Tax=Gambusia affinis TaxID=33528 RepID=UPI001CDD1FD0|nr:C-type lectin domain family 4 member A-like isoform X2 [Gambusia affinis]
MAAAEVTYADVKLPKSKGKADNRLSSEVTYSEVRRLRKLTEDSQPFDSSEMRNPQPRRQTKRRPTAERGALLVLSVLLAAAIIALSVTQINCRNTHSELKMCKASPPPSCPPPPEVKEETFQKCEEGWEKHGRNCYYLNTTKSTWNDSRRFCIDRGSDLVKIDSREEQTFLGKKLRRFMNQMKMNETETFWIGLTESKEEEIRFWVDGSPLNESLSFWSEPGNKHGGNEIVEGFNQIRGSGGMWEEAADGD